MDDTEQAVRLKMTNELREAASVVKARKTDGTASPYYIWQQFVRHGLYVDENVFHQWRSGRLVPLITSGDTGLAFFNAELATKLNGHYLVQPDKWQSFCHRVEATRLAPLNVEFVGTNHDVIDEANADPDDLAIYRWLRANSIVGKRKIRDAARKERGMAPETDEEAATAGLSVTPEMVESVLEKATMRAARRDKSPRPGARMVWLPNPDVSDLWWPYADGPSTAYWPWHWGITKEAIKVAIGMASSWSTNFRDGVVDIENMDATRFLYRDPVPPGHIAAIKGYLEKAKTDKEQELKFRKAFVQVINWRLQRTSLGDSDWEEFDRVMNYVKGKTREMIKRDMRLEIPLTQLIHWFNLAKLERGE